MEMADNKAYTGDFILDIWVSIKIVDFREKIKIKTNHKVKKEENSLEFKSLGFRFLRQRRGFPWSFPCFGEDNI